MQGRSHALSGDQGRGAHVTNGQLEGSPGASSTKALPNETHAASAVYFETVFAYFADVIKRTFRVLCRRHLNPVGQENFLQLQQQPAIILSVKVNSIT